MYEAGFKASGHSVVPVRNTFRLLNRNQDEVRNRGGIRALCRLLKNRTDDMVRFDILP